MLYSEFIKGTRCKDSKASYEMYGVLEAFYLDNDAYSKERCYSIVKNFMNDNQHNDLTKEQWNDIYEQLCYAYATFHYVGDFLGYAVEIDRFEHLMDANMKIRTLLAEPGKFGNEL